MPFNRRSFLEKISKIGALSTLSIPALGADPASAQDSEEKNFFITGPYLQDLAPNEVTIMWITHKNSFSWVEYGDRQHLNKKYFSYQNGLIQANNRINKITLRNIKPQHSHRYRIVSTEILGVSGSQYKFGETLTSEIYSFNTPGENDEEFKMVVFNDNHERSHTIPQLLYKYGYDGNKKDFDLVVFNGDVFDTTDSEEQVIGQFLKPCVEIFARETPFLFVQGNHEVRGAFSRNIPEYFEFPDNKFYHAFTRGPVRLVVLDAGEDKADDNWEYGGLAAFDQYREIQQKWLEKEIETEAFKKAAFRVVLIHISPFHSGDWHGTMHCREMFGALLNKGKIDLLLSGHTHRYATHDADATHSYPIVIGGGPQEGKRTLIKLHATKKELNLKMIRDDGEEVGKYSIRKT